MLGDEMGSTTALASAVRRGDNFGPALRSQSLVQNREAAAEFLPGGSSTTNDDRILACALYEAKKSNFASGAVAGGGAAGGVVVITLDNNLACKARANGLRADSPVGFAEHYLRRMESLRSRVKGNLVGSVLRR